MTSLRVVAWNAEGMFALGTKTRRATPEDGVLVLKTLRADIVVIPEFGTEANVLPQTLESIEALGYNVFLSPYNDERAPGMCFAILSKLRTIGFRTMRLSGSTRHIPILQCLINDTQNLSIIGIHLDDRNEAIRMQQVRSLSTEISNAIDSPLLVMGDFNAMDKRSLFARVIKTVLVFPVEHLIPSRQLKSVIERASEMAKGTTIEYLTSLPGLNNIDPKRQSTISAKQAGLEWMPALRLAKIDWIFGSEHIVPKSVRIVKDVGSDHRPVIADLEVL